jgi:hypothetical protein
MTTKLIRIDVGIRLAFILSELHLPGRSYGVLGDQQTVRLDFYASYTC